MRNGLPELSELLCDIEAAQRSSAISQETFRNRGHVPGEDAWLGEIRWMETIKKASKWTG